MVTLISFRVCGLGDFSVKYSLPNSGDQSKSMDSFKLTKEDIKPSWIPILLEVTPKEHTSSAWIPTETSTMKILIPSVHHELSQIILKGDGWSSMIISQWEVPTVTWSLLSGMDGFLISTMMPQLPREEASMIHFSRSLTNGTILILLSNSSLLGWLTQTKELLILLSIVKIDMPRNGLPRQKDRLD